MQILDKGGIYNTTAFILDIKSFIVLAPDRSSLHKNTPFLAREMGGGRLSITRVCLFKKKFRPK